MIKLPKWMRVAMLATAAMNILGAITFLLRRARYERWVGFRPQAIRCIWRWSEHSFSSKMKMDRSRTSRYFREGGKRNFALVGQSGLPRILVENVSHIRGVRMQGVSFAGFNVIAISSQDRLCNPVPLSGDPKPSRLRQSIFLSSLSAS
jgi:hypothetical protein